MSDTMERRFVRMFNGTQGVDGGADWWAQRAAASGSGGGADLPDFTFAEDGLAFAGEEKTTAEPYVYVTPEEHEALQAYATAYGMHAVVVGRFKKSSDGLPTGTSSRAFYVWNPNDMETTDAGTLRGSPTDRRWAAKIAEPDGTADGIHPEHLTSFHLHHGLAGELGGGITEPPANSRYAEGEADG